VHARSQQLEFREGVIAPAFASIAASLTAGAG
jgi:hypothetical protein